MGNLFLNIVILIMLWLKLILRSFIDHHLEMILYKSPDFRKCDRFEETIVRNLIETT